MNSGVHSDPAASSLAVEPESGRTDAERNCISNIRPDGLAIAPAVDKLLWLIAAMRRLRLTGIALKDEQPVTPAITAVQG